MVKIRSHDALYVQKSLSGTDGYYAPESLKFGEYSVKSDIWMTGCLLYGLVSGYRPFSSGNRRSNLIGRYHPMTGPHWRGVDKDAIDLIRRILVVNPEDRPSIQQMLEHPWLRHVHIPPPSLSYAEDSIASSLPSPTAEDNNIASSLPSLTAEDSIVSSPPEDSIVSSLPSPTLSIGMISPSPFSMLQHKLLEFLSSRQ
jgi:serine/threonine protein kinase